MKTRTLLATCLSFILVLAFAASAFATPIWTASDADIATVYTKTAGTWSSGPVTVGTANSMFNFDFNVVGSWDGKSDPNTRLVDVPGVGKATWDWLTVNVYKDGVLVTTQLYDDIDNGGNVAGGPIAGPNIHYETLLALTGVYTFEAIGHMTVDSPDKPLEVETWRLNAANVTPTPLPAAVWMLGSGLLGFMGFKSSRKNNA